MKPHLSRIDEFKTVLEGYEISDEGKAILAKTNLVLLVSPTSAGRNTIIRELVKTGKYEYIVSDTTRPPRSNNGVMEQSGVEYFFRSEEDMLNDLRAGLFLEAELIHNQQVSGISLRELKKATLHHKIAINEVDHEGIYNVYRAKQDLKAIMILPPSAEEWMRRLKERGDMTTDEIQNRLVSAEKILEAVSKRDFYKIVINDNLDEAVANVRAIVELDRYSEAVHEAGQAVAWKLLGWVKQQLNS